MLNASMPKEGSREDYLLEAENLLGEGLVGNTRQSQAKDWSSPKSTAKTVLSEIENASSPL